MGGGRCCPKIPASFAAAAGPRLPSGRQPSAAGIWGCWGWGTPTPGTPFRLSGWGDPSPSFWGGFFFFLGPPPLNPGSTTLPPGRGPARPMRTQSRRSRGLPRSAKPISPPLNPRNPYKNIYILYIYRVPRPLAGGGCGGGEVALRFPAAAGQQGFCFLYTCVYIYFMYFFKFFLNIEGKKQRLRGGRRGGNCCFEPVSTRSWAFSPHFLAPVVNPSWVFPGWDSQHLRGKMRFRGGWGER